MGQMPTGTVTFLFTDIEGSTERWERERASMAAALERHNAILSGAIETHAGSVFKTVGDAYCAAFSDAGAALEAAIEAQRLLHGERFQLGPDGDPLRVRMGIHTGLVEIKDGDYFGRPVNRVARLMSAGHGGQILVSLATQQLVRDALPDGARLLDLGVHRLKDLEHSEHVYRLIAPGMPDVDTPPDTAERLGAGERAALPDLVADAACPYRGLHAFREEDARFFFGREVFTERLVMALTSKPMVGVIGPSGSGKSSVVYAGMLPALRNTSGNGSSTGNSHWTVLKLRPGAEPFHAIAGAVVPLLEGEMSETARLVETRRMAEALLDGTMALTHVIDRARGKRGDLGGLLFIVDQFEELYTLCPGTKVQRAFQDLLFETVHVASRGGPVKLALTLRADFMGHATAYRPFSDAIQDHNVILGPMNREELGRVIAKPAELQGRAFEPGLVERIMDDVGEEAGSLPLLEFALTKLWEGQAAGWLTHEAYEAIGRVEGAVARHADAVYDGLTEANRDLTHKVFVQLVRPGEGTEDTRRVAHKDELDDEGWAIVRQLADARLVVTNRDEAGRETAEVVHEALIRTWGQLKGWMNEDRRFRMWQERLRFALRQWQDAGRDDGALLRGVPLAEAEEWLNKRSDHLGDAENRFIEVALELKRLRNAERLAQIERERTAARALRRRATGLAMALAVAAALAVVAVWFGFRSEHLRDASFVRELASSAAANLEIDPELSTLLALTAVDESLSTSGEVTSEALSVLHQAVQRMHHVRAYPHGQPVRGVAFSPDGQQIVTVGAEGSVKAWDVTSSKPLREMIGHDTDHYVRRVRFRSDGALLATSSCDGTARSWWADTGRPHRVFEHSVDGEGSTDGCVWDLAWSPDGQTLATAGADGFLRLWDVNSGGARSIDAHDEPIFSVRFSPLGQEVITSSMDGTVVTWDVASAQRSATFATGQRDGSVDVSPDGSQFVITAGSNIWRRTAQLWDIAAGVRIATLSGHEQGVFAADFSPDGTRIATASHDGTARVWDARTGATLVHLQSHRDWIMDVEFSPDGRHVLTGSADGTARLWNGSYDAERFTVDDRGLPWSKVSADGSVLVAHGPGDFTGRPLDVDATSALVLDTDSGEWRDTLDGHVGSAYSVSISEDGQHILSSDEAGWIRLWDGQSGTRLSEVRAYTDTISWLQASADGSTAVIATDDDQLIAVWDVMEGNELFVLSSTKQLRASDGSTTSIALSPDGQWLGTVYQDGSGELWSVQAGTRAYEIPNGLESISWSKASGRFLLLIFADGTWRLWDTDSGDFKLPAVEPGPKILSADWTAGDHVLALSRIGGTIEFWDLIELNLDRVIATGAVAIFGLGFSDDGALVAGATEDSVKVWDVMRERETSTVLATGWVDLVKFTSADSLLAKGPDLFYSIELSVEALKALATSRLTRTFTPEDCRRYLHVAACPADAPAPSNGSP